VDRRKELDLALFPGYVFVRMALASRLRVLQLPGVVRLVSFHGQLAALPAEEIAALQDQLSRFGDRTPSLSARRTSSPGAQRAHAVRTKDRCRVVLSIDLILRFSSR
jgi:transcription antitermination factor NusG